MMKRPFPTVTRRLTRLSAAIVAAISLLGLAGCIHHTVEVKPLKVEPLEINVNITIREQVEQDLSSVFGYDEKKPANGGSN